MAKPEKKIYNWEYYQHKLKEYCDYRLSYSSRIPMQSRAYGRKYYSPWKRDSDKGSTGSFWLNDRKDQQHGTDYTGWWDNNTRQGGDIYKLMTLLDGCKGLKEAYARCEEMFGPAPEISTKRKLWWNKSEQREVQRAHYREQHNQPYQADRDEEDRACNALRKMIEEKTLQTLRETGSLFTHMDKIPMYLHEEKGQMQYTAMTCTNYMQAMQRHDDDPRYMSRRSAEKLGYQVRADAVPIIFEYMEHKDDAHRKKRWPLYNAKDIIGLEPYQPLPELSPEEVRENIKTMILANGGTLPKEEKNQEQLVGIPESLLNGLREIASQNSWYTAQVEGQRYLEQELVMTQLLQYAGSREPYAVAGKAFVERHLERDLSSRGWRNLFRSGMSMDKGVKHVIHQYDLKRLEEQNTAYQEVKKRMKIPFDGLSVTADRDISLPGYKTIPKGVQMENIRAYRYLAALSKADKTLFARPHAEGFGREVAFTVQIQDTSYPVRMSLGKLDMGNTPSVLAGLRESILRPERAAAYDSSTRKEVVREIMNRKAFEDPSYREAVEQNPAIMKDRIEQSLRDTYQQQANMVTKVLRPYRKEELQQHKEHPEFKQRLADTYRYYVPDTADKQWTEEELLQAYEAPVVLSIQAEDRQNKTHQPLNGHVVETRVPLGDRGDGVYVPLGKTIEGDIPQARPLLQDIEQRRLQDFNELFTVTLGTGTDREILHGEDARTCLSILMAEDRELFAEQQTGYKDVEMARPQRVAVSWGKTPLWEKTLYPGRMELGNAYSVGEAVAALANMDAPNIKQSVSDLQTAVHTAEKYVPDQELLREMQDFTKIPEEIIQAARSRQYQPLDMDQYRPNRIGQKLEHKMTWYAAMADVNFAHEPDAKAAYVTKELAGRYKKETVEKYMLRYYPEQRDVILRTMKEPAVVEKLKATAKRIEASRSKGKVRA